jgi:RecB family exonuclease
VDFPIATLRKATGILDAVSRIVLSIPYEASADEMAAIYRTALADLNFKARLLEQAREAPLEEADLRRAALDLRGLEGLEHAIDAVVEAARLASSIETPAHAAGDTRMTRSEFRAELQRAMESHEMLVAAETEGAVRVLGATDMRGMTFAVVFVLGLAEGEFPERARGDWIYPQHERENFRAVGLPLEDLSPEEALRNEEHYFYQVVCRATHQLWLCRPLADDADADTIPSVFIAEVERALGANLETVVTSAGFDAETLLDASTPGELATAVVRARSAVEFDPTRGRVEPTTLEALERFAREDRPGQPAILSPSAVRRIGVERAREAGGFDEFDGLLRNDLLRHLLASAYAKHVFSASELNEFGNCGFRFFLKRVLGLTPRVEAALDLQAIETGVLLHDALRRFFEPYRGRSLADVAAGELDAALSKASEAVFDVFEHGMPPLNPRLWRIERRVLAILLGRVLRDEVETQRRLARAGVAPRYLELAFGLPNVDADPRSSPDPLVLRREPDEPTSEEIMLRGQIDRVDASDDGRLIAYDYKTSSGPRLADMLEGRDLQLGIYLAAIEQLFMGPGEEIAGGGYYALKPLAARRNNGLYRADLQTYTDIRPTCASNVAPDIWDQHRRTIHENLWAAYDRIRGGDFRVAPSLDEKTCEHCDFARICRFDRHRIQIKRRVDRVGQARPLKPIAGRTPRG